MDFEVGKLYRLKQPIDFVTELGNLFSFRSQAQGIMLYLGQQLVVSITTYDYIKVIYEDTVGFLVIQRPREDPPALERFFELLEEAKEESSIL